MCASTANARSTGWIMSYKDNWPYPPNSARTSLFEHTFRYVITFNCVRQERR